MNILNIRKRKKSDDKRQFNLRLPDKLYNELKGVAENEHRNIQSIIYEVIENKLND